MRSLAVAVFIWGFGGGVYGQVIDSAAGYSAATTNPLALPNSGPVFVNAESVNVTTGASGTGIFDLSSVFTTFNYNGTGGLVGFRYAVDGVAVGQTFYETLQPQYGVVSLSGQVDVGPGSHTVTLQAENFSGLSNLGLYDQSIQATGYNAPAGQPAATGTSGFTTSPLNLPNSGPVFVNAESVNVTTGASGTGLFNVSSTVTASNSSGTTGLVGFRYAVDGTAVGQIFYQSLSSGYEIVTVPEQLMLTPGAHTVTLQAENFSGLSNLGLYDQSIQATGYNAITVTAIPEPSPFILGLVPIVCSLVAYGKRSLKRMRS